MFNRYFEVGENNVEFLFAHLTVKNIDFALVSLQCLLRGDDFDRETYMDEHTYYFFHIQSLLTACGNISNVFYQSGFNGRSSIERSKLLRERFEIRKSEFALIFQKEVRNTNEHFDERLDAFGGQLGDYNILDNNTPQHMRDTVIHNPHLRTFDRDTGIYYTYNRQLRQISYNLHELRHQLEKMRVKITTNSLFDSGWIDRMPGDIIE